MSDKTAEQRCGLVKMMLQKMLAQCNEVLKQSVAKSAQADRSCDSASKEDVDERYAALQTLVARMADDIGKCKNAQIQQEETEKKTMTLEKLVQEQQGIITQLQA